MSAGSADAALAGGERSALVRAMVEICAERGYREATPDLIAERAGLDRAAFDRCFESTEECFLAIWDIAYEDLGERILGAYCAEPDWQSRLRAAAGELLRLLRKRSFPVARVLALESDRAGIRAAARRDRFLSSFSALIDAGRFEGADGEAVPAETAMALTAAVHHTVYSRLATGREGELKGLVPELMCMIVTPYLGHEAGFAELERAA